MGSQQINLIHIFFLKYIFLIFSESKTEYLVNISWFKDRYLYLKTKQKLPRNNVIFSSHLTFNATTHFKSDKWSKIIFDKI